MKGYTLDQITSPFFEMPETYEEQVKVYRTLAKAADQRLVRLESYEELPNFKNATKWSYARAMRDIQQWSGESAKRFNTAPPKSSSQLLAKIEDIKTFIKSPTSTKKGMKEILQKRADTLNERYGTNFKWDDVGTFFESGLAKELDKDYASRTMVKVAGELQKNKDEIIEAIKEGKDINIKVPNKLIGKVLNNVLKKYGDEVVEYLEA